MIQNFFSIGNPNFYYLFPESFNFFEYENYQFIYDSEINRLLNNNSLICPKCQNNIFSIHSSYVRYIVDTPQQQANDSYYTLDVKVVYCHHCKTYHAILPAFIPAFSHFSYHFIFSALSYLRTHDLQETCHKFHITKHILHIFINKVGTFFLRVMKSHYLHLLHCIMESNREQHMFFIHFLMQFFFSQASSCTLQVFFGRPLYLSIIIPNQNEP